MRLGAEAHLDEMPHHFQQFAEIVGRKLIVKRYEFLKELRRKGQIYENLVLSRFSIELAIGAALKRTTYAKRLQIRSADDYRALSFVGSIARIYQKLTPHQKKRLCGMVIGSFRDDFGLGPCNFEIANAVHLMSRGFDVHFSDLDKGSGFDLLASLDGTSMEVECKHLSADIGRQIHRKQVCDLALAIQENIDKPLSARNEGAFVEVVLTARLEGRSEIESIAQQVGSCLLDIPPTNSSSIEVTVEPFLLRDTVFGQHDFTTLSVADANHLVKEDFRLDGNVLTFFRAKGPVILVRVSSKKRDAVVWSIFIQLKDAAKRQFTGTRPAVMCVHLADLAPEELKVLSDGEPGKPTGLQQLASAVLRKRPVLDAIIFSVQGETMSSQNKHSLGTRTMTTSNDLALAFVRDTIPSDRRTLIGHAFAIEPRAG